MGRSAGKYNENSIFLCSQPGYYINDLNYRELWLPDSDPLSKWVSLFFEASAKEGAQIISVVPDGCVDLVASFSNGICENISVCGTITKVQTMSIRKCDYIFSIRFKPGMFPIEIMGDVNEFLNMQIPLTQYERDTEFIDKLMISKSFEARIKAARNYVYKACSSQTCQSRIVEYAMMHIISSGGNISISDLSRELIYSPRYIEKVIKSYTGFTPKTLSRLVRAKKANWLVNSTIGLSKTFIATQCGYSDLSHMNRDIASMFGELSNTESPSNKTKSDNNVYHF